MFGSLFRQLRLYSELISLYPLLCSLQNWIEDLYWKQHDINYPGMDDAMVCKSLSLDYVMLCICVSSDSLISPSPGTPWFLYCIPQYNTTSCNSGCCWKSKEVLWRYSNYSNRAFNGRGNGFILCTWFNGNYNFNCFGMHDLALYN